MAKRSSEKSKTENHINHRILSWCDEHKMKLILAILVLGSLFGGLWYYPEQNCAGFKLNLSWDTTEGGKSIPTATEDIEVIIDQIQEAKLVITVTTPRKGIVRVNVSSPEQNIELYTEDGTKKSLPCAVVEWSLPKGVMEVTTLQLKTPPRPTKYGITICATLDNQCEKCKNAYFTVTPSSPSPSTMLPTPAPEPWYERLYHWFCGTSILAVVISCGVFLCNSKR